MKLINKITTWIISAAMALGLLSSGMAPITVLADGSNSFTESEQATYTYLTETAGFSKAAACGIMGGIFVISKFDPTTDTDDGYGICGWDSTRKNALTGYASNYESLAGQLDFMVYEMKNSYPSTYNYLVGCEDSEKGAYSSAYQFVYKYADYPMSKAVSAGTVAQDTYWPGLSALGTEENSSSSSDAPADTSLDEASEDTIEAAPEDAESATTTYYVYNCSWLNYRTSPDKSSESNIAGCYKAGTAVNCDNDYAETVEDTTWFRFTKDGNQYYISSKYLTTEKPEDGSGDGSGTTTYYVSGCSYLNYRTSPDKSSSNNIAGTYKVGTEVKCNNGYSKTVDDTTWYSFDKDGSTYFISSKYLSKTKPSTSTSSSGSTKTYYVTASSGLNYRTGPGLSYKVAGAYSKGTKLSIDTSYSKSADGYTWYRFSKNGTWYYVASKYLSTTKPSSSSSSSSSKKSSSSSSKKSSSSSSKKSSSSSSKKSSSSSSKNSSSSSSTKTSSNSSSSSSSSSGGKATLKSVTYSDGVTISKTPYTSQGGKVTVKSVSK